METKTNALLLLRNRRFMLLLPLLALPFLTLLFWALGGGKSADEQAGQAAAAGGLNVALPDTNLKDDNVLNKLSYYEKAATDSAKLDELMKNDPYYRQTPGVAIGPNSAFDTGMSSLRYGQGFTMQRDVTNPSSYSSYTYSDTNEAKVHKKLNELNTALNGALIQPDKATTYPDAYNRQKPSENSADIDRLERLIGTTRNDTEDPELKQLNSMMEKILDIQHPERIKESVRQASEVKKGQVFAVAPSDENENSSVLANDKETSWRDQTGSTMNGFYSLDDDTLRSIERGNLLQSVMHETQTVVDGSVIKLRLLNDVYINGALIPKGQFLFGTVSLNGERLNIKISSIRYRNALFPVQLYVVDLDGIEGVYIPGAITRDVAKGSAERVVQGIGLNDRNPSIGAQAANAGIEAAKTLLTRKAKLVKVTIKAGYQVFLQNADVK